MKCCDKHWTMMRAAIEARGISHLVAKDGHAAMTAILESVDAAQEQRPSDAPYDPLMSCVWMVYGSALERGGLYLMTADLCPICEAMAKTAHWPKEGETEPVGAAWVESHWIDGPADAALEECRLRGLVATQ